jgi:hypothetical protein
MWNPLRHLPGSTKVIVALFGIAAVQGGIWAWANRPGPQPVAVGERFTTVDVQQRAIPMTLDFRAIPRCTHVVFLRPNCPLCQELAPRWAQEYAAAGHPAVLAVSFSGWDEAEAYASKASLGLPLYATGADDAIRAAVHTRVMSVPTIAVMGEGGRIAALAQGRDYTVQSLAERAGCAHEPGGAPLTR